MKDMPVSKVKIYKYSNKFLWMMCLYQKQKCIKTLIRFYERYASIKFQNK